MSLLDALAPRKSRLGLLLDHFATIDDPRDVRRVAHPLAEVLLLVVCGTMADCDDYDHIAAWGAAHLDFLRRHLPYAHGIPGGRWLTMLMNRINPALFSAAFTAWVRETWPGRPEFVAIDGKTSRRSHNRAEGAAPLHLVSAFAATSRLVLGQEAVPDKAGETVFAASAGMGKTVRGRALVASDGFSARYDLDRIAGVFSRPEHKLAGCSYVGTVFILDRAKGGVATAWMLHEMASRGIVPAALVFNTINPIMVQGAALAGMTMMSGFAVDITRAVPDGAIVELDMSGAGPLLRVVA